MEDVLIRLLSADVVHLFFKDESWMSGKLLHTLGCCSVQVCCMFVVSIVVILNKRNGFKNYSMKNRVGFILVMCGISALYGVVLGLIVANYTLLYVFVGVMLSEIALWFWPPYADKAIDAVAESWKYGNYDENDIKEGRVVTVIPEAEAELHLPNSCDTEHKESN